MSETLAMGGRVFATNKGVRVTIPAPALNWASRKGVKSGANPADEVKRTTRAERDELIRLFNWQFDLNLRRRTFQPVTKTIGR